MKLTTFVFDLDGTLVDSVPGIEAALVQAFASIGRTVPLGRTRSLIGPPIKVIAKGLEPSLSCDELVTIESAFRKLYDAETWQQTSAYPAVASTLRDLHANGNRLFLVTNKPLAPTTLILAHLGLAPLIQAVITRDAQDPPFASKGEMLCSLLTQHAIDPSAAIMIGDTAEDAEAAAQNAMRFLFVQHGYGDMPAGATALENFAGLLAHCWIPEGGNIEVQ